MKAVDIPERFDIPFADSATGTEITFPIPQPSQTGGKASLTTGFPPINSQPVQSGGIPPWGADFNGILKMLSLWAQWQSAGGPEFYDSSFSTENTGYPKGAILASASTAGKFFFCLADDNTNDPDSVVTNWLPFFINNAYPPAATVTKLAGSGAAGGKLASWTVSEIVAAEAIGSRSWKGTGLTLSFNGATTGAGGMDTGAMPTAADLAIYAIYNPTTNAWSTLGTTASVATAPYVYAGANMPAGYTSSALIWVGKTTGGNFVAFSQVDKIVSVAAVQVLTGANSGAYTTVSIASVVPAASRTAGGYSTSNSSGSATVASSVTGGVGFGETGWAGSPSFGGPMPQTPCSGQAINYKTTANPSLNLFVTSYGF